MIIEKNGVTPPLTFKDLAGGEAFFAKGSLKETLMVKGYNFQGIGHCAMNLANGAVTVPKLETEVVRANAKVVV